MVCTEVAHTDTGIEKMQVFFFLSCHLIFFLKNVMNKKVYIRFILLPVLTDEKVAMRSDIGQIAYAQH